MSLDADHLLAGLPPEWPEDFLPRIQAAVEAAGVKVVVLDDDPTGTQTVHGVDVWTSWHTDDLNGALYNPEPVAYVLTNSRSVPLEQARAIHREIVANLRRAAKASGRRFVLVSRSDSTLRGHFPGEVNALAEALEQPPDGILLIPFFLEGGRYTINDVHYVREGGRMIPAGETEFARDPAFGYHSSNLLQWVAEKSGGAVAAGQVATISIDELRRGGPEAAISRLQRLSGGQVCVVNAASYRDLEVFVLGLLQAEAAGKRFLYRTAASFVRVRGGIAPRGPLTAGELGIEPGKPGLVVVGSYVEKTGRQLEALQRLGRLRAIELLVPALLRPSSRAEELRRAGAEINAALASGEDAVVFTSREVVAGRGQEEFLAVGQQVSEALVALVREVEARPGWVIAKGGITSSVVARDGLGIRQARVLGQAIAGVPVWRAGAESRWPGLVTVIFPGNVGGPAALSDMAAILRRQDQQDSSLR